MEYSWWQSTLDLPERLQLRVQTKTVRQHRLCTLTEIKQSATIWKMTYINNIDNSVYN